MRYKRTHIERCVNPRPRARGRANCGLLRGFFEVAAAKPALQVSDPHHKTGRNRGLHMPAPSSLRQRMCNVNVDPKKMQCPRGVPSPQRGCSVPASPSLGSPKNVQCERRSKEDAVSPWGLQSSPKNVQCERRSKEDAVSPWGPTPAKRVQCPRVPPHKEGAVSPRPRPSRPATPGLDTRDLGRTRNIHAVVSITAWGALCSAQIWCMRRLRTPAPSTTKQSGTTNFLGFPLLVVDQQVARDKTC